MGNEIEVLTPLIFLARPKFLLAPSINGLLSMSKFPSVKPKKAIRAFEAGFAVVRVKGSHHAMKKEGHEFLPIKQAG